MSNFSNLMQLFAECDEANDPLVARAMESIVESIGAEPELRFFLDGTLNGGHQAATVHMLRRLITLTQFRGRITVIYADIIAGGALGRTPHKLALLMPGLDPNRIETATIAYGTCQNIGFLNYERRAELGGQARFGFTAGADDMNINFARELRVDYFLRLQPYLWDDDASKKGKRFYESSRIETPAGKFFYPVDHYQPFRAVPYKYAKTECDLVDDAVWNWYAAEQTFDQDLKIRTSNIQAVYNAHRRNPALVLWPVYGLHQFRGRFTELTKNLALTASQVQHVRPGPIVLLLLNAYSEIGELTGFEGAMVSGFDAERGRYLDISEKLASALANARDDEIIVAAIGPIPGDIYNYLYANCEMAGVFEGQNTSSLTISLGRPFLQIQRESSGIGNPYPATIAEKNFIDLAACAYDATLQLRDADASFARLARTAAFILAARDPASEMYRYFQKMGSYYQNEIHDKCFLGLVALAFSA